MGEIMYANPPVTLDEFAVNQYGKHFNELCVARQEVCRQIYFVKYVQGGK